MNRTGTLKHFYTENSSADSDILKQGYLKMKTRKVGRWKSYWIVLRRPSSKGVLRIEKYSNEKSFLRSDYDATVKTVPLHAMSSVELSANLRKNILIIWCSTCSNNDTGITMSSDSEYDIQNWCDTLRDAQQLYGRHYEDFLATDKFNVDIMPSPLLPFHGEYVLHVTDTTLVIYEASIDDHFTVETRTRPVVTWPLNTLRRYGREDKQFTIESGRSCPTGEGLYIFHSHQAEQIYQKVHRSSLKIAATTLKANTACTDVQPTTEAPLRRRQTVNEKTTNNNTKNDRAGVSVFRRASTDSRRPLPPPPPKDQ